MPRVLIFSGAGRYADPWHPFEETTAAIADVARGIGADVTINHSTPDAFASLADVDLVVVNAGGGDPHDRPAPEPVWDAAQAQLAEYLAAGGPLLGTHTAAAAFPDWPSWRELFGGAWVRGTSFHPERNYALFEATPDFVDHPIFAGIEAPAGLPALAGRPAVLCYDERYSAMVLGEDARPHLVHETGEKLEVCGWVTGDRIIYDGLGHNARSYESSSRRRLLANEMTHLLSLS
ncbi:ThuA domain-containing protein [Propioniciclava coleopterorum]|uniref:ThuA domain-containing protein n=1 Tax=Propioniciclava coleopterorum TaxID=2714937 RepID=A0A6G7Y9Q0_9ACTN|nr:ThuA domain-containing protein [Propioniciclava coleopterorum]QIK73406.1 ThuA domain-containing protein [Propioniciclava coleopterorum]